MMSDIKLFNGECLSVMESNVESRSVDLILTDLPYGTTACKWDIVIPFTELWEQYNRIIKDNGIIVLTGSQPFTTDLIMSNRNDFRYEMIWEKPQGTNPLNAAFMPLKNHENICIFYKNRGTYNPQMEKGRAYKGFTGGENASIGEVYGSNSKSYHKENFGTRYPKSIIKSKQDRDGLHPTQKPVYLMEYLIKTFSNKGDTVLDSCMGSGTTGVACKNTCRNFVGIEMDEKYFKVAKNRIDLINDSLFYLIN